MSTISCIVVEDDPQAYEYAQSIVERYGNIEIIGNSDSIHEAARLVKKLQPDFLILDVFLTDGNAFEFLELFEKVNFKIIFTTSFAKYALDAFKCSALDYLLKPYSEQELINALDKVTGDIHKENYQLQLQTLLQNFSNTETSKKIVLKNADAMHVVKTEDILYAKADNNYTSFLLANNKEILVSKPLKSFEERLTPHNFFRVHQSFLINLSHISSFNKRKDEVILKENHTIPVAQSRKRNLIDFIEQQN